MSVSVVIPMYNAQETIGYCLEGLLNQTIGNLEIICVDDGSKDATYDICMEYAQRNRNIQVFKQENSGPGKARNVGTMHAKNEYVGYMDADDFAEPEMYQMLYELVKKVNADVGICNINMVDAGGRKTPRGNKLPVPNVFGNEELIQYVFHREPYHAITGWVWNKIFRRKMLADNSIWNDERLRLGEDIQFMADVMVHPIKAAYCDQPLCDHIYREGSLSKKYWRRTYEDRILAYEYAIELFEGNRISESSTFYVKVFHCYHAANYVEQALQNGDRDGMKKAHWFMKKYLPEYMDYNRENEGRLARIKNLQEAMDQ